MSSNSTRRLLTKGLGVEQLPLICISEIIMDSASQLDTTLITMILRTFSFRTLQVIQCFKCSKNARVLFLILSIEASLSKEKQHCISSAYECTPRPYELTDVTALLNHKLNRTDPKIKPWCTPDLTSNV